METLTCGSCRGTGSQFRTFGSGTEVCDTCNGEGHLDLDPEPVQDFTLPRKEYLQGVEWNINFRPPEASARLGWSKGSFVYLSVSGRMRIETKFEPSRVSHFHFGPFHLSWSLP